MGLLSPVPTRSLVDDRRCQPGAYISVGPKGSAVLYEVELLKSQPRNTGVMAAPSEIYVMRVTDARTDEVKWLCEADIRRSRLERAAPTLVVPDLLEAS